MNAKAFGRHVDLSAGKNWEYARGLGRVFAGAILFSLPILMTMEMWWLGFYLDPTRLVQFAFVNFLVLVGVSRLSGFEKTASWFDDVLDALSAYAVAAIWSALVLWLFGILECGQPAREIVGKITLEAVPASFGAMRASKQLGSNQSNDPEEKERSSYWGQLLLMLAGALFVGFSVAPTEEMILISFRMSSVHSMMLIALSILLLHGLVYTVGFKGEEEPPGPSTFWGVFVRFSVVGYGIAALASLYLLWTFGRVEGTSWAEVAAMVAVLAFPGAIGAALARLVV
jgi:putative integral membrane protein (TIGR02587 family)